MSQGRARLPSWLGWLAKIGLTLLATYFLFRSLRISWHEIEGLDPARWLPDLPLLLLSVIAVLAGMLYVVWLWARLIRALGGPAIEFHAAVAVYFTSALARYLPGKIWQLAGLAYLASRRGVSPRLASLAAVLAQIFSLGAAVLIASLYFLAGRTGFLPRGSAAVAIALAAGVLLLVSVPAVLRFVVGRVLRYRPGDSSVSVPLDRWFGPRWLLLHLPAWGAYGLGFAVLWTALPALPDVDWIAAAGAFAAAYVLGYAALFAPAGIGVREGVMAVLLAPWLGPSSSAVLAIVARVWLTLAELVPLAGVGARRAVLWLRGKFAASAS